MNRRDAVSRVALLLGGTVLGSNIFLQTGCSSKQVNDLFTEDHVAFLDEVAETILPKTKTPGAKEAKVGAFMSIMVKDCYTPEEQKIFVDGMAKLDEACVKLNGKKYMDCDMTQRTALLTQLENENKDFMQLEKDRVKQARNDFNPKTNLYEENNQIKETKHYYRMMKELTLLGYFTSEVGATQALRYLPVPGKYDGNYPYKKGDKAWAI